MKSIQNTRLLLIGAFPGKKNKLGGETIKNQAIYNYIKQRDFPCTIINTENWRDKKLVLGIEIIKKVILSPKTTVILSAANTGARYFLILHRRLHLKNPIFYWAIGGTLGIEAQNNEHLKDLLKQCKQVFLETSGMQKQLVNLDLHNVQVLPNFRTFFKKQLLIDKTIQHRIKRGLFLSRVCEEKGIELAVEAIKRINCQFIKDKLIFDIYGPIEKSYKQKFNELIATSENITYKGIINLLNEDNYSVLSQYDFMLFPTSWYGEGFPGSIIDSFIAGVPVYASDWAYNSEIVKDGITGRIFKTNNLDNLVEVLLKDISQPQILLNMRKNCIKEAQKYHVDNIIPTLLRYIL